MLLPEINPNMKPEPKLTRNTFLHKPLTRSFWLLPVLGFILIFSISCHRRGNCPAYTMASVLPVTEKTTVCPNQQNISHIPAIEAGL